MDELKELLPWRRVAVFSRALVVLLVGLTLARIASAGVERLLSRRVTAQQVLIARRATYWSILGLALASVLNLLGFDLSVLLGAAGVLTVAIGFASQTSASNLISGLFLIGERPFVVGDVIQAGDTTGEVVSIDLLSVKLRTMDNLFVRVPNEALLKSQITNLSYYRIRRFDLKISVTFAEDLSQVRRILFEVADKNLVCMIEPKPLFIFLGFGPSTFDVQFSMWSTRDNFVELRNTMAEDIKRAFDAAGIALAFPTYNVIGLPGPRTPSTAPGDPGGGARTTPEN